MDQAVKTAANGEEKDLAFSMADKGDGIDGALAGDEISL
jgi:hypothetical protein